MVDYYVNRIPNRNDSKNHHEIHKDSMCCVPTKCHRLNFKSDPEREKVYNAAWDRLEDAFDDGAIRSLSFCSRCLKAWARQRCQ